MGVYKGSIKALEKAINNHADIETIKDYTLQAWRNGLASIDDISDFIEEDDVGSLRDNISITLLNKLEDYMSIPHGTILDIYEDHYQGAPEDFYFANFDSKFFRALGWGTFY